MLDELQEELCPELTMDSTEDDIIRRTAQQMKAFGHEFGDLLLTWGEG